MTISFECPSCLRRLKVPDKAAGRTLKCPACESRVEVPVGVDADDLAFETEDPLPSPRRRKKRSSAAAPRKERVQHSEQKKGQSAALHPAIIPTGIGTAGILLGAVIVWMFVGGSSPEPQPEEISAQDIKKEESSTAPATANADAPTPTAPDSHSQPPTIERVPASVPVQVTVPPTATSPGAALEQMIVLLEQQNVTAFLLNYAPVEMLRRYRDSIGQPERLRELEAEVQNAGLLAHLRGLGGASAEVAESGLTAFIRTESTLPTAVAAESPEDGYGDDLTTVISQAVNDLEAGQIKLFVQKMFPPEALQMMNEGPPGSTRLQSLNADSLVVERMLTDLRRLKTASPVIDGVLAEYTLEPLQYSGARESVVRPNNGAAGPPDRRIRFSRIGGHWRFYAGIRAEQLSAQQSAAEVREILLERVGDHWRLLKLPVGSS